MNPDHVYTQEELINTLTDFTKGLSDDVKASIDAKALGSLENLSDGINQLFNRLDLLKQTEADQDKTIEDYKAKIAQYAALQADRMKAEINAQSEDQSDPVQDALDNIKEDD